MHNIINTTKIDYTKEPIFLGNDLSFQRYDKFKHQYFYKNFHQQVGFFWRPEEISLIKDRNDFKNLSKEEEFIFTSNLKFQILLDSIQSRAIPFLTQYVSLPEVEISFKSWEFFETIHSYSYSYIINNIYPDSGVVFDSIYDNAEIIKRAGSITKYYNELINNNSSLTLKDKIYLTLISVNILEGIRFYVSFSCVYAMAENKKMEGNAKIISFINRDENLHLAMTQMIINKLREDDSEGFTKTVKKNESLVQGMYVEAVKEEIEWAEYLFSQGSILGLNTQILSEYMKWLTNKRMSAIGLEALYSDATNPLKGWIANWTDSKRVQVAPQETEMSNYKIGEYTHDLTNEVFDKMFNQ